MIEDHQHQMNWERGQIDYLGVDSFDNILRKIDTSISPPVMPPEVQVQQGPPPVVTGQTEHQEMFVRGSPRRRQAVSNEQMEECKRSPAKKSPVAFRRKPKPMRGRGQQDHRERFVRRATARNQQSIGTADLAAVSSGLS